MKSADTYKFAKPRYVFDDGAPFRVMVAATTIAVCGNEALRSPFPLLLVIIIAAGASFIILLGAAVYLRASTTGSGQTYDEATRKVREGADR